MKLKFFRIKKLLVFQVSLLDYYLIKQLSLFFLFSVCLLASLGVAIGTISDLSTKITEDNLPITVAITIFGYKIPEYIAYALPISLLLTNLIIYGRLSSDRELIALFSFGISFYRVIFPSLVFGLAITVITFLFNELIVPTANYQANLLQTPYIANTELNLQKQDLFYLEYHSPATNSILSNKNNLKTIYFAEQYRHPNLQAVTIVNFEQSKIKEIITAKLAQWNQQQQVWELYQVKINTVSNNLLGIVSVQLAYKKMPFAPTMFEIASKKRSAEAMNIQQAKEYLNLIQGNSATSEITKLIVQIQQKYAFSFICLIFTLIGATLGTKYSHNRSQGFGLCVGIVFIYYVLGFTFGSLGIAEIISPLWAAWLPNCLGLVTGIYLFITVNFPN